VDDAAIFEMPIAIVNEETIRESHCDWFVIDAISPNDETARRESSRDFLEAVARRAGAQQPLTVKYVSWEEDGGWLGYLQDYPDYWTQGETQEDLKEHLRDLYVDLTSGQLPGIRKVDDLVVS
jgi:hypothetical protein